MRNKSVTSLLILLLAVPLVSAKAASKGGKYDEFYEKTRLIMLKSEKKIYKLLQSPEAKLAFIKDFWKKRDPNPETAMNEGKLEFDRRIAHVDKWYRERVGKGRGWDSDRGKMYLLLGPPNQRDIGQGYIYDSLGIPIRVLKEIWVYDFDQIYLEFADAESLGVYRMRNMSPRVLSAIDDAKFGAPYMGKSKKPFKFKAQFSDNALKLAVPSKYVSFQEIDGVMEANFKVTVYVYHNYKRVDDIVDRLTYLHHQKDELLKTKKINLTVPYSPPSKGKYIFDIILEDAGSTSRHRDIIKKKI